MCKIILLIFNLYSPSFSFRFHRESEKQKQETMFTSAHPFLFKCFSVEVSHSAKKVTFRISIKVDIYSHCKQTLSLVKKKLSSELHFPYEGFERLYSFSSCSSWVCSEDKIHHLPQRNISGIRDVMRWSFK